MKAIVLGSGFSSPKGQFLFVLMGPRDEEVKIILLICSSKMVLFTLVAF